MMIKEGTKGSLIGNDAKRREMGSREKTKEGSCVGGAGVWKVSPGREGWGLWEKTGVWLGGV